MVNQYTDPKLLRTCRVQVSLSEDERLRLARVAQGQGRTLSGLIRSALRVYCDELESAPMVQPRPTAKLHLRTDDDGRS